MPFGAWETGVKRTTSAGGRVIGGAACGMGCILAQPSVCEPSAVTDHPNLKPLQSGRNAFRQSTILIGSLAAGSGARTSGGLSAGTAYLCAGTISGDFRAPDQFRRAGRSCQYDGCIPGDRLPRRRGGGSDSSAGGDCPGGPAPAAGGKRALDVGASAPARAAASNR